MFIEDFEFIISTILVMNKPNAVIFIIFLLFNNFIIYNPQKKLAQSYTSA